jgi:hypothetical protein
MTNRCLRSRAGQSRSHCDGAVFQQRRSGERRDPYVDGPRAASVFRWSDRIACIHMSGLLMRLVDRWPRWFSAIRVPNTPATFLRPMGPTDFLAPRIDRSYHLSPFAAPAQPVGELNRPVDLLGGECRCHRHPRAVVTLACHQQFPGDASSLVGERHRGELWRFAPQ